MNTWFPPDSLTNLSSQTWRTREGAGDIQVAILKPIMPSTTTPSFDPAECEATLYMTTDTTASTISSELRANTLFCTSKYVILMKKNSTYYICARLISLKTRRYTNSSSSFVSFDFPLYLYRSVYLIYLLRYCIGCWFHYCYWFWFNWRYAYN